MHFIQTIVQAITLAYLVVLIWIWLDMRFVLKSSQRKAQLSVEGRWKELEEYFERTPKTWRPFAWFHYHYRLPGNITVQHALYLFKMGRPEEALTKADMALQEANGTQRIFWFIRPRRSSTTLYGALRTRILALSGLGRYDEARETANQFKKLSGKTTSTVALLELYCGRLDEALVEAEAIPNYDKDHDAARSVAALAYIMRGEFGRAIQTLSNEPAPVSKFYSPTGLQIMQQSAEGAKLLELQQKRRAMVFDPARFLRLADAYLGLEDFKNADLALDQAENCLGPIPAIQGTYCRLRARSFAAQGKPSEMESYIGRLGEIAKLRPLRSFIHETHFAIGQAYLSLGRVADALAEFSEAQCSALHPIEKHSTAYWTARAHEAAGDRNKAIPFYQVVASDPIPSWMRKKAAEALEI